MKLLQNEQINVSVLWNKMVVVEKIVLYTIYENDQINKARDIENVVDYEKNYENNAKTKNVEVNAFELEENLLDWKNFEFGDILGENKRGKISINDKAMNHLENKSLILESQAPTFSYQKQRKQKEIQRKLTQGYSHFLPQDSIYRKDHIFFTSDLIGQHNKQMRTKHTNNTENSDRIPFNHSRFHPSNSSPNHKSKNCHFIHNRYIIKPMFLLNKKRSIKKSNAFEKSKLQPGSSFYEVNGIAEKYDNNNYEYAQNRADLGANNNFKSFKKNFEYNEEKLLYDLNRIPNYDKISQNHKIEKKNEKIFNKELYPQIRNYNYDFYGDGKNQDEYKSDGEDFYLFMYRDENHANNITLGNEPNLFYKNNKEKIEKYPLKKIIQKNSHEKKFNNNVEILEKCRFFGKVKTSSRKVCGFSICFLIIMMHRKDN